MRRTLFRASMPYSGSRRMALVSSERTFVTADLNSARRSSGIFPRSVRSCLGDHPPQAFALVDRESLDHARRKSIGNRGVRRLLFERLSSDMYRGRIARKPSRSIVWQVPATLR